MTPCVLFALKSPFLLQVPGVARPGWVPCPGDNGVPTPDLFCADMEGRRHDLPGSVTHDMGHHLIHPSAPKQDQQHQHISWKSLSNQLRKLLAMESRLPVASLECLVMDKGIVPGCLHRAIN